nr:helix-turn-helix domain-containing protein [Candidatus Njordarchaeota archaeon]
MPPHEGERDQHSEDDDKDGNLGEDSEEDFLNRGENETEPTMEESLREYYEELDDHEQPGDKDTEETTIDKDNAENEDEPSAEDRTLKHCEDTEESSRDDSEAEHGRIEQCLDEYEKALDPSAPDTKEGDKEDDANPLGASTDESHQEREREPHAHDDEATDVELDTVEHENQGIKESREDLDSYDFRRCLAEYDETISITKEDSSGKTMDWERTERAPNEGSEDQTRELGSDRSNSDAQDRAASNESTEKQAPNSIEKSSSENHYEQTENKESVNAKGDSVAESRSQENERLASHIQTDQQNDVLRADRVSVASAEFSEQRTSGEVELNTVTVHDARVIGAGELVRSWRTELGLNQYELADKLGYDQSQVSYWESNHSRIPFEDLQQLAHMAGRDLSEALSGLRSGNRGEGIEWKGETYSVGVFKECLRNPHATLEYNKAQQTYYLELNPMADVKFHQRDIVTTVLEREGIQTIARLTAKKGVEANIRKATVEGIGIEQGDKVNVRIQDVRNPEDQPWKQSIPVTPSAIDGEARVSLRGELEGLGFKVNDGDYVKMTIQTERGEAVVVTTVEGGAITLSKNIQDELLMRGAQGDFHLGVVTDSIVLSPIPFREKLEYSAELRDAVPRHGLYAGEGLTITAEKQSYRLVSVEQEKIGDLELFRYRTRQGEEFLHIPSENRIIPPYETPWYALPSNTEVYLDKDYKQELLRAAIDKAGGETAFRHDMKNRGTTFCSGSLYRHLHEQRDGMATDKLIPILRYLHRDLDEPTSHITKIGHCGAIENPNLSFNLSERDGTRLLAARYGDGTLCAPKGRGPRFDYGNNDVEQRSRITESLGKVFGGANILNREYDNGEVPKVRTSSDIIGYTLQRAGAITGEIVEKNPHIPTWIREGSTENKREWLIQAFGDEGYVWPQKGKACIGRSIESSTILSEDMTQRLDRMDWKDKVTNGKWICAATPCRHLPADIHEAVEAHPPNILAEEKKMLADFGIQTRMYPLEMHQGKYGDYSAHWVLQTETREDSRHFLHEIGFPQERKQDELISVLRLDR